MQPNIEQMQVLDEALPRVSDDAANVDALNARAWEVRMVDLPQTWTLSVQAEQQAVTIHYHAGRAKSLYQQGWCLMHQSDYAGAEKRLNTALGLSRHGGDVEMEGNCLTYLGTTFYSWGNYPAALDSYLQALRVCRHNGSSLGQANALDGVGCVYHVVGDFGKALDYHLQALRLRKKLPRKDNLNMSFNNVGSMYSDMGNHAEALGYHLACLHLCQADHDFGLQVCCLSNLTHTYSALGQHDDALAAGQKAVQLARSVGNRIHECDALLSLGTRYQETGKTDESLALFEEALTLAQKLGNQGLVCQALILLGGISTEQGEAALAEARFRQALEIAEALELKEEALPASLGLSESYEAQGQTVQALALYKKYRTLEKEFFDEAADRRSKTMLMEMQVERAQQEAELHRVKNVELAQANRQLQQQAELLQMQTEELRAQADELARQAHEDGLTGLANRRALEGFLAREFADAVQHRRPLTVVLADIDHFKQVNDRFGHQVGDEVLMRVARLLRQTCRASDLAARYGGEEFVLVLPETGASAGRAFCERLRLAVAGHPWGDIQAGLSVTLSLGMSADLTAANHERLLGLADAQLYRAKQSGRNQVSGL